VAEPQSNISTVPISAATTVVVSVAPRCGRCTVCGLLRCIATRRVVVLVLVPLQTIVLQSPKVRGIMVLSTFPFSLMMVFRTSPSVINGFVPGLVDNARMTAVRTRYVVWCSSDSGGGGCGGGSAAPGFLCFLLLSLGSLPFRRFLFTLLSNNARSQCSQSLLQSMRSSSAYVAASKLCFQPADLRTNAAILRHARPRTRSDSATGTLIFGAQAFLSYSFGLTSVLFTSRLGALLSYFAERNGVVAADSV
jgi:hypothetical protein